MGGGVPADRVKIGFVFSTKDRVELSRRSLTSVDTEPGVDLLWIDGSDGEEGRALPRSFRFQNCRLLGVHEGVGGGPDPAIRLGLGRLLALGYDYCGLIENDIVLAPGWRRRLLDLFDFGARDGLRVGAATVRTFASRVLFFRPRYAVMWATGAGLILFSREAADVVLRTYASTTAARVARFYRRRFAVDLSDRWELRMGQEDRELGCDWAYTLQLYRYGLTSLGAIPSAAVNIDADLEQALRTSYVMRVPQPDGRDAADFGRFRERVSRSPRVARAVDAALDAARRCAIATRHPIRSARVLGTATRRATYRALAERQLRQLHRGERSQCWCGAPLLPFRWHASYGSCAEGCGYVNRRPPLDLYRLYESRLYWHVVQRAHGYGAIESRGELYRRDGRLGFWLHLIARYGTPAGRVVEVGCAPGVLLKELSHRGYECVGVEPDRETAAWIRRTSGVDVRAAVFPDVDLPECDMLLAFDVLEHATDPHAFLAGASRLLREGGVTIVQTPIERYGYDPPFGAAFESAFKEFEHLFLFTERGIERLAAATGFTVISSHERFALHHEVCVLRRDAVRRLG